MWEDLEETENIRSEGCEEKRGNTRKIFILKLFWWFSYGFMNNKLILCFVDGMKDLKVKKLWY